MPARHFSPPWTVDDNGTCFIVRDHNGQALAYCYYEVEPGCRPNRQPRRLALEMGLLTIDSKDEKAQALSLTRTGKALLPATAHPAG